MPATPTSQKMRELIWNAWRHEAAYLGTYEIPVRGQGQGEMKKASTLGIKFKGIPKTQYSKTRMIL